MKSFPQSVGFGALIMTVCLNSAGLIWLRRYSTTPDQGLIILAVGYLPMAFGLMFSNREFFSLRPPATNSIWAWIGAWAASVVSIYFVFLMFPKFLTVSQLIIAQSITPLLAVIVAGEYRTKTGRQEPLRRLIPLTLLLVMAWLEHNSTKSQSGSYGEVLSFIAICIAFLIAQSSMRRLAQVQRPLWVLPRFALATIILISTVALPLTPSVKIPEVEVFLFGVGAGLVIILIQGGYLFGISKTPPLLSAMAISSSVPVTIFFEWFFGLREARLVEVCLAALYFTSVTALAAVKTPAEPLLTAVDSNELNKAA